MPDHLEPDLRHRQRIKLTPEQQAEMERLYERHVAGRGAPSAGDMAILVGIMVAIVCAGYTITAWLMR